jgi:hypothetical protein
VNVKNTQLLLPLNFDIETSFLQTYKTFGMVLFKGACAVSLLYYSSLFDSARFFECRMHFHIHILAALTWSHVHCVEKNAHPTPQQATKRRCSTKQNPPHKQTHSTPKNATPTQKTKQKI